VRRLSLASTHPVSRAVAAARRADVATGTAGAPEAAGTRPAPAEETAGGGLCGDVDGHDVLIGSAAFVTGTLGLPPVEDERTAVAIDGRVRGWIRVSAGPLADAGAAPDAAADPEEWTTAGCTGARSATWCRTFARGSRRSACPRMGAARR
jgi:cation transport ATPase